MVKKDSGLIGLVVARSLCFLAISGWLGGLGFFGAFAAPAMFRLTREYQKPEIAPILVGVMLGRFNVVTYILGTVLVVGWLVDGAIEKPMRVARLWWWMQGAGSLVSMGLALYLGLALLPYTVQQQNTVLPIFSKRALGGSLTLEERLQLAQFDVTHKAYNLLASINLWTLLIVMVALAARLSLQGRVNAKSPA